MLDGSVIVLFFTAVNALRVVEVRVYFEFVLIHLEK